MNNEEKILELLEKMLEKQNEFDRNQAVIEKELKDVKSGQTMLRILNDKHQQSFAVLERGINRLEQSVSDLKDAQAVTKLSVLKLENVDIPKLQATVEGFIAHDDKLADHERRIGNLETA